MIHVVGTKESTKQKGTWYVELVVDGRTRYYTPENQKCLDFFAELTGHDVTVLASESREAAVIEFVDADTTATPPAAPAARAPQTRPVQPARPPQTRQAAAPPTQTAAAPAPPAQAKQPSKPMGFEGQTVGMCMKEAITIVCSMGTDPFTTDFYKQVHIISSNLIRVSETLKHGNLSENIKDLKPEGAP